MQKAAGFGITVLNDAEIARRRAETEAILKQVDGICSFATFVAHAMKAQHGISPSKVFPIGAGAIREVHGEVPTNIERYKKRRILFVGRQWERKGGPILLEAFKRVRKELPDATLTVVSSLAQFEPQEGVEHIKFASNEELHELYKACSVFTMPSICETWGLVYVEAAMHGLPTANWDNWALPDIVDHGQSGVLTSKHNAEGLAEALIEALRDPVRLQGMGKASISRVKDVLAWPWVYERLLYAIMPEELQGKEPKWMRPRPLV
jgi:glycosyltransferase involved in cell wall biosynthesis